MKIFDLIILAALAAGSIAFATADLRPKPLLKPKTVLAAPTPAPFRPPSHRQNLPDPAPPFGPADVSLVRHASTILDSLAITGCENIIITDPHYMCPTRDFLGSLLTTCESGRTKQYVVSGFDCDDIAREYHVNASKWSVATYGNKCPAGIAMGEAYVKINGPVDFLADYPECYHVINILCLADGQWVWIEPVFGTFVNIEAAIYEGLIEVQIIIL